MKDSLKEIATTLGNTIVTVLVMYLASKYLFMPMMSPPNLSEGDNTRLIISKLLGIKRSKKKSNDETEDIYEDEREANRLYQSLNKYERLLAESLVVPDEIDVTMDSIGGLDEIKTEVEETIVFPFKHPNLYANTKSLRQPVKGVLLHGPPGTGKTMLAKAIAKECGCCFINLEREKLKNFLVGESEKLASAVFTLAEKLQPAIIFIDEIESVLSVRGPTQHEVSHAQLSIFLTRWDGFQTSTKNQVIVIGATNCPDRLDPAAMRRLPLKLYVGMPDEQSRLGILQVLLQHDNVDPNLDLNVIAKATKNYTGSDLKEMCKRALQYPIQEAIRDSIDVSEMSEPRPLAESDLLDAMKKISVAREPQQQQPRLNLDQLFSRINFGN